MFDLLKWWFTLELMALVGLPIVAWLFPGLKDKGVSVARLVGLLLVAYPVWLLSHGLPLFGTTLIVAVFLGWGLLAAFLFYRDFKNWDRAFLHPKDILVSEMVWLSGFLLLAWVRSYNPEIEGMWKGGGSEKFMDLNFINSILMSRQFPPQDNWFHGFPINYYYYGYYLAAVMIKLTGVLPHVGYNLMTVTVYALAINGLWGLLRNLNCRAIFAALGVFLAFLATNLKSPWLGLTLDAGDRVWIPWRSSRVIDLPTDRTINEFPWFSFLWNDLHGHLSALPFEVGLIALCWGMILSFRSVGFGRRIGQALLIAVAYGSLITTNAWDIPCYAALIALSLLAAVGLRDLFRSDNRPMLKALVLHLAILWFALFLVFKVLFQGFFANFVPPTSGHNIVPWEMKSPIDLFLLIFGGVLAVTGLPLLGAALQPLFSSLIRRRPNAPAAGAKAGAATLLVILAVLAVGGWFLSSQVGSFQAALTPILLLTLLVLAVVWLLAAWWRSETETDCEHGKLHHKSDRYVALLLCLGLGLVLGCEFVAVKDFYGGASLRLNTVFKFHSQAWILLSIAAAYLSNRFINGLIAAIRSETPGKPILALGVLAQLALIAAVVGWTGFGSWSMLSAKTSSFENKPTLDGLAYAFPEHRGAAHRAMSEDDARALLWLLDLQRFDYDRDRLILEYSGDPYSNDGRVSTFSGIPTLMAVANHEGIWNREKKEAMREKDARKVAVQTIYSSPDFKKSRELLDLHKVTHVFFGTLERNKYGEAAERRFERYMKPLKRFGRTTIYSGYTDAPIETATLPDLPAQPLRNVSVILDSAHPLSEPRGAAVGPDGTIHISNSKKGFIDRYSPEGEHLGSLGSPGETPGTGELNPNYSGMGSVRVDSEGRVYVADTWNHRIAVFESDGSFGGELRAEFWGPRDLLLLGDRIIVADTGKHRLVVLDGEGKPLSTIGREGAFDGEFKEPVGLAAHRGEIFVADVGNLRIQVFGPDLKHRRSFPVAGWENTVGAEPYLAFDSRGSLWATDSMNSRILQFSPDGRLMAIHGPTVVGGDSLKNAKGIAAGPDFMVLSDFGNGRLLKWNP